jgi:hypothetical protein
MIYVGSNSKMFYALNCETGELVDEYEADGKISSPVVIDNLNRLYVSTWATAISNTPGKGYLYALGTRDLTNSTKKKAPSYAPTPKPELMSPYTHLGEDVWVCRPATLNELRDPLRVGDLCVDLAKDRKRRDITSCIPGLVDYLGHGVDISYDINDPSFIQDRVLDFDNLNSTIEMSGKKYVYPKSTNFIITPTNDKVITTDPILSGYFGSVRDYTRFQSEILGIMTQNHAFPAPKIPSLTATTILANATGINSNAASETSERCQRHKYLMLHASSLSKLSLELKEPKLTSSMTKSQKNAIVRSQTCSFSFRQRVRSLPEEYDVDIYREFVEDFGTHVLIGVTIGGTVQTMGMISSCNVETKFASIRNAFLSFSNEIGKFTTNMTDKSTYVGENKITRRNQWVYGGKNAIYKSMDDDDNIDTSKSESPWKDWTKTIMNDRFNKPALLNVKLIPLYAVLPRNTNVQNHVAVAIFDYLRREIQDNESELDRISSVKKCNNAMTTDNSKNKHTDQQR